MEPFALFSTRGDPRRLPAQAAAPLSGPARRRVGVGAAHGRARPTRRPTPTSSSPASATCSARSPRTASPARCLPTICRRRRCQLRRRDARRPSGAPSARRPDGATSMSNRYRRARVRRVGSISTCSTRARTALHDYLGAHRRPTTRRQLVRRVGPEARAVGVVGDFNGWEDPMPLGARGSSGIWVGLRRRRRPVGQRYKYLIARVTAARCSTRPIRRSSCTARRRRRPASVVGTATTLARQAWMTPRGADRARRAGVDLRGPPRLVAARPRGRQPVALVSRAGAAPRRPRGAASASPTSS